MSCIAPVSLWLVFEVFTHSESDLISYIVIIYCIYYCSQLMYWGHDFLLFQLIVAMEDF